MEGKIRIINMDILDLPGLYDHGVEAVVNSTNARTPGAGGLDKHIHKRGGESLTRELEKIGIGEKKEGDVFVTSAPGLDYSFIIHTIVPKWNGGIDEVRQAYLNCYKEIIEEAEKRKIRSLAMIALGVGHRGVPDIDSAEIAAEAVKNFLIPSNIEDMYFVLRESHVADVYMSTFDKMGIEYDTLAKEFIREYSEKLEKNGIDKKDIHVTAQQMNEVDVGKAIKKFFEKNPKVVLETISIVIEVINSIPNVKVPYGNHIIKIVKQIDEKL